MTDPTGHREGCVGRNEEHSCDGLFPYRQDLKFPVQHITRCLTHLLYSRAELGRVNSSISGIRHPHNGRLFGMPGRREEMALRDTEKIIYKFIWR